MAPRVEKLDHNEERLFVELSKEELQKAMETAYNKNKRYFNVPGFRKGKAPMPIVLNYYGESVLYEDAVESVADAKLREGIDTLKLHPFSHPTLDVEEIGRDKGATLTFTYAAKPTVELSEYLGVTAYRPGVSVTEEQIDQRIEHEREHVARMVAVERPVQQGDFVTMDYQGTVDGEAFNGGSARDAELEIGSGHFIPGFEDKLLGHSVGESFDIDVSFPEDYHEKSLAGKAAVFHIDLKEVREKQLPEVNDDFIRDISEDVDTVEAYRARLRAEMEQDASKHADQTFIDHIMEIVMKEARVDYSPRLLSEEMGRLYQQQEQMMQNSGFKLADYLRIMGMTERQYMAHLREPADQNIRRTFILDAISEKENIEVSDADVEARLQEIAERQHMELDEVRKIYSEDRLAELKDQIRLEKTEDLLRENAVVTDVDPHAAEEEDAAAAEGDGSAAGSAESEEKTEEVPNNAAESQE